MYVDAPLTAAGKSLLVIVCDLANLQHQIQAVEAQHSTRYWAGFPTISQCSNNFAMTCSAAIPEEHAS